MKTGMLILGLIGALIGLGGSIATMIGGVGGTALGLITENSSTAYSGTFVFWSGAVAIILNFFALIFSITGGVAKTKNTVLTFALAVLVTGLLNSYLYNWVSGGIIVVGGLLGSIGAKDEIDTQQSITKSPLFYMILVVALILTSASILIKNGKEVIEPSTAKANTLLPEINQHNPLSTVPIKAEAVTQEENRFKYASTTEAEVKSFLSELQNMIAKDDANALSKLINYPLRVPSVTKGIDSGVVENAEQFIANYYSIINQPVKKSILDQNYQDLDNTSGDITIGNGIVWLRSICQNDQCGSRIIKLVTINTPLQEEDSSVESTEFKCNTEKHIIIIGLIPKENKYHYRSWNKPKLVTENPDMEIFQVNADSPQGTGACRYNKYRFKKGKVEFILDNDINCGEKAPPQDAVGNLHVLINGEVKSSYICYKHNTPILENRGNSASTAYKLSPMSMLTDGIGGAGCVLEDANGKPIVANQVKINDSIIPVELIESTKHLKKWQGSNITIEFSQLEKQLQDWDHFTAGHKSPMGTLTIAYQSQAWTTKAREACYGSD